MNETYARDLDLNLLRVFVVVAEAGSVTAAAARLYLTQPAVSASLRRLADSMGGALFVRQGRGVVLTERGRRLLADARPHLQALVDATAAEPAFDPRTSDRVVRLGLADTNEAWLLPALLLRFERVAPALRVIAVPVQFRTVGDALLGGTIDAAVTVADELPTAIRRTKLFHGGFVAMFDPRRLQLGPRVGEAAYFAAHHVIVSYNGDLRGVIEDMMRRTRKVRCSVSSFANVGAIVEGSNMIATIPKLVAQQLLRASPQLRTATLPFTMGGAPMELLWPRAREDDPLGKFVRGEIASVCDELLGRAKPGRGRQSATQRKPLLA